jgi:hypothetical protein
MRTTSRRPEICPVRAELVEAPHFVQKKNSRWASPALRVDKLEANGGWSVIAHLKGQLSASGIDHAVIVVAGVG